jgi:protein-S-isoprenylcysteine O-methyltransferase Ste14
MTSIVYDLAMRLPLLSWMVLIATMQFAGFIRFTNEVATIDIGYAIHLAMRLSTIAFLLLIAAAVILRTRPSGKASGLEPRISALAGTFLMYGIVLFPRHELSLPQEMISTLLALIGTVGAVAVLSQLGRSFSVMAETRQLVTTGPYRLVRHPLYLTEEIAILGLFIQFASVWTALLMVLQICFQLRRMHNEESVLAVSFPEYVVYSRNTARLIPGIY